MKKLIVANWKMNPQTLDEARTLIASWEHQMRGVSTATEVAVAAPFVFLPELSRYTRHLKLAAQNMSWADKGPLTGEISGSQLAEFNVGYVILGHSERRLYLGETDSVVNAKIIAALKNKITPIVCLGAEVGAIKAEIRTVVTKQFIRVTKGLKKQQLEKIVYVYEPAWAISTMKHSEPETGEHANELVTHIYNLLTKRIGRRAQKARVLYGGTVNKNNVQAYAKYPQIGGALVGAASLDAENFWEVIIEFSRESIHKQ